MKIQTLTLENKNGFTFETIYYQRTTITKENKVQNPFMLIFAGGGFTFLSKREQEPIALKYLSEGFNVALVNYNLLTQKIPLFPNAALCGLTAIEHFRKNAVDYQINPEQVITAGFSAGGSAVAIMNSLLTDQHFIKTYDFKLEDIRPNGTILGYPLLELDSLQASYPSEFQRWIPEDAIFRDANLGVSSVTPPTFLFHTANDDLVPVSNTLHYAQTLDKHHVPFEIHIYPNGVHGLATARKISATDRAGEINKAVETWMTLSITWLNFLM